MSRKWYADGLHSSCQQGGACWTGEPGCVWLSRDELGLIAEFLKISEADLRSEHVRRVGFRLSLKEKPNGDCTFLQDGTDGRGCKIYSVRPLQCRTWPFWRAVVHSRESWEKEAELCKGMNQGPLYNQDDIRKISNNDGTHGIKLPSDKWQLA